MRPATSCLCHSVDAESPLIQSSVILPSTAWVIWQKELGHRTFVTPSVSYMVFTFMPQRHCQVMTANIKLRSFCCKLTRSANVGPTLTGLHFQWLMSGAGISTQDKTGIHPVKNVHVRRKADASMNDETGEVMPPPIGGVLLTAGAAFVFIRTHPRVKGNALSCHSPSARRSHNSSISSTVSPSRSVKPSARSGSRRADAAPSTPASTAGRPGSFAVRVGRNSLARSLRFHKAPGLA